MHFFVAFRKKSKRIIWRCKYILLHLQTVMKQVLSFLTTNGYLKGRLRIMEMTEAEKLALIRKELFDGFTLEDVNYITEGDRRELMLMHAERILGLKPNGEAARYYASEIYGEKLNRNDTIGSFLFAPQEGVDGWISDLMKLLACLLDHNPWGHLFSLRWLSAHFNAANGNDPYQFSPKNEQLLVWLERTVDRRIAALVGKMVQNVAEIESQKISVAIYDYIWEELHQIKFDCANEEECNGFVNNLLDTFDKVNAHIKKGRGLGLSIEEIGLIDSLWCEVPNHYPQDYVDAAKEIWQKIKAVRDNFADGRKTYDDCQLFITDMVEIVLPITEKHKIDMELDDEHSLPMSYLKYWLDSIYFGNDPHFG